MARGMAEISRRRAAFREGQPMLVLAKKRELEEYCYYVAGTVGEMLTSGVCVVLAWSANPNWPADEQGGLLRPRAPAHEHPEGRLRRCLPGVLLDPA
jgi:hypothetical protein